MDRLPKPQLVALARAAEATITAQLQANLAQVRHPADIMSMAVAMAVPAIVAAVLSSRASFNMAAGNDDIDDRAALAGVLDFLGQLAHQALEATPDVGVPAGARH